jgi:biopolymer transport protein ExbD
MSSKRRRFPIPAGDMDMNPMIDIVFNLLIFFMCATKFRTAEGMIESYLPKNRGTGPGTAEIELTEVRIKLLWCDATGRETKGKKGFVVLKIGDEPFNAAGDLEAQPYPETSTVWASLHAKILELKTAYNGSNPKGRPVIIDSRQHVPTKFVVSTLNEVVRAGIQDVTFAAPELPY